MNLPQEFQYTVTTAFGTDGRSWLKQLPDLIAYCRRRWSLSVGPHFADLSYNFVAPAARSDGTEVVLKLGVPRQELLTEAAALHHYDGRGSVHLIDAEPQRGILILERIRPGSMLAALWPEEDDRATEIAAAIMRQLWRSVPEDHSYITVEEWFKGFSRLRHEFNGGSGPFPAALVDQAERLYADLMASTTARVLLHGDLHHYNILAAQRQPWLAIDPKGVVGDAVYDAGALLRNPFPLFDHPDLGQVLARRIAILAETLEVGRQRIAAWSLAQAVLSAWWSYEDHGSGWEPAIHLAEQHVDLL